MSADAVLTVPAHAPAVWRQRFDLAPNALCGVLGLPDRPAPEPAPPPFLKDTEQERRIAECLLRPLNVTRTRVAWADMALADHLVASGAEGALFVGDDGASLVLVPADDPVDEWMARYFDASPRPPSARALPPLTLAPAAAAALLALADLRRRRRLEALLARALPDESLPRAAVEAEFAAARRDGDPRWLLPLFLTLAGGDAPDGTAASAWPELRDAELLAESGGDDVVLTEVGAAVVEALARRRTAAALRSLYFRGDVPTALRSLLIQNDIGYWGLDWTGEGITLARLDEDGARSLTTAHFAPGDPPPEVRTPKEEEAPPPTPPPATTEKSDPAATVAATGDAASWTCGCGRSNAGNFCGGCGNARPKPSSPQKSSRVFCAHCGAPGQSSERFCGACGAPRPL